MGGGFRNLNAVELSSICNPNQPCNITTYQNEVTNNAPFSTGDTNQIKLDKAHIRIFVNNSNIKTKDFFIDASWNSAYYIEHFYNYGCIETKESASLQTQNTGTNGGYKNIYNYGYISGYMWLSQNESGTTHIINYGEMGGVSGNKENQNKEITIDNRGAVNLFQRDNGKKTHFKQLSTLTLKNYVIKINDSANVFNSFDGNATNNAHLVVDGVQSVRFANSDSRLIIDFGSKFELGKGYSLENLVVDTSGNNQLNVDLLHLIPYSDIYYITQQGDKFVANLKPESSAIGNLYKANVRTMNNFLTMSNSVIYPRKYSKSQNLGRKNSKNILSLRMSVSERGNPFALSSLRASVRERGNPPIDSAPDSAFSLKSYESFAYQNESQNPQARRIQRQNKRNYSRNVKDSSLRADSQNLHSNPKDLRAKRSNHPPQNLTQNPHDYYFILTPFINHNLFFESGRYNLSGFDYGFLTAFSGKIAESNTLGAHFMMNYGTLGDSHDKNFHISNLNLNLGLNYKLDLVYDMFLKVRGDVFYFANALDSATLKNIKPNNLGFGASVSYGKDFDFKQGGVLGIEGGIDYKALKSNYIKVDSQSYQKALYDLIYADLGLNYQKYFGGFGINLGGGFKANLAPNLAKSILLANSQNLDFVLDNDKFLGYANLGLSYVLNHKNFDMEFSLAYYGNFGDRIVSNGGGFEWRVNF